MMLDEKYQELYGEIPIDKNERLSYLIRKLNIKRGLNINFTEEIKRILNIPWKHLQFTIYLIPKGTPRPRTGRGGTHFYVKGASDNKRFFKEFYKKWNSHPKISTACKFYVTSYFPLTSSMRKYEMILAEMGLIRPITKPDFDNLAKTYADMIQGTLLSDDALIIEGTSKKYYSMKPRIEISISYMDGFDSLFNKRKMKGDLL